jgi:hypothetical protein
MSKIVRDRYPAASLPSDLLGDIRPDAIVKVTIEQEPTWNPVSGQDLAQQLREVRQRGAAPVSVEEAVRRIRELRDEWEN